MYTVKNFKTKKSLKEAVNNYETINIFQPGPFGGSSCTENGQVCLEGPHYPEPHRWYATATIKNGCVVYVK